MNMLLREELARNLVSMTSQILFATLAMTNSAFHWVSSTTPVISESLATVLAAFIGTTHDVESRERERERTATGAPPPQEDASDYYYNAIHTVVLLLVVWIYFKTILVVWRSLSAFWETTKGVWKFLGAVGSWLARFVNRWRWWWRLGRRRRHDADASMNPPLQPNNHSNNNNISNNSSNNNNNTAKGHSQFSLDLEHQLFRQTQHLLQGTLLSQPPPLLLPPLLPPPPQGAILYYFNPITHNLVPWFSPPPQFPPPLAPMAMVPQALPPHESFFVPISETPRESEPRGGHIANANANTNTCRAHELSPLFGSPAGDICGFGGQSPDGTTAMGTLGMTKDAKATPTETVAGQPATDPVNATTVANSAKATEVSANNANPKKRKSFSPCGVDQVLEAVPGTVNSNANANANAAKASANRKNPKKRKSFCGTDQVALDAAPDSAATGHATESEAGSDRRSSKRQKQKRQRAKAKARAKAKTVAWRRPNRSLEPPLSTIIIPAKFPEGVTL